jgi:hypothetical protein
MDIHQKAIETYVNALVDIATMLQTHREVRAEFEPDFLARILRDGFLQTITEAERDRIWSASKSGEDFLLWQGVTRYKKMNWNSIGWIFPFYTDEEMEQAYEIITRAVLSQKSWPLFRQLALSFRLRFQGTPIKVPTNIVKVRVTGDECQEAMRILEKSPPNLRYVTKAVLDQLPQSHYLRRRIRVKLFVGEKLEPYVLIRK